MSDWIKRRSYIRTAVRMIYAKSRSACVSWIRPNGFYACLCISMHICVCAYQPYSDSLSQDDYSLSVFFPLYASTQLKTASKINWHQKLKCLNRLHTFSITTPFPCTGRLDLAIQINSLLGKEFEMVIQWILSFSFSSITIRLFLCGPCRAPAVQASPRCLPWCLLLQQLPPYFLLLIWGSFFCCRHPLMTLRHRNISLLCNPEQRACANQAPTVLTHFYKVR